jgi:endonuclease YncB( thermonuclease family)
MRKTAGIATALLALAVVVGGIGAARHYGMYGMLAGPAPAEAASGATATAAIAPPAPAPNPAPMVIAAAVQPPAAPDADLPSIEVAPRVAHTVPADSDMEPAPHVTMQQRDGRILAERATPLPAPPPRATRAATDPAALAGAARPISGPILSVAGRTVRLFGVRAADAREHCGPGGGVASSCIAAANAALAARLGGNAGVTCTMPSGQSGDPGFICHDAAGIDLGGLLVAQGLALVDRSSSYQYLGAEDAARISHQGLWRYR